MPKYITVKNSNELQKYLMDRCPMLKENPPKSRTIDKRIKELSRYADFEKIEGKQGYKIKNIYDFPKPKVTKYSKEYLPLLEDNLLQFLLTMGNSTIMSKSQLAKIMNMVNINYYPLKYRKKKLSRYTGLKVEIINEFYKTTTELNDRNILQVLKSLKSRGLINFKPCMVKEEIFTENIQEVDNNGEIVNKINNYSIYS